MANATQVAYDSLVTIARGPLATAHCCKLCMFHVRIPKGGVGRGYGLASSAVARGEMFRHLKEKHGEEYRAAICKATGKK